MEPNGIAQSRATMEHIKVSAKGKAKNKSTKENAKLKAPPRITATVQQLQNTTADGIQSLPDAGSVAQLELLQRIKFAYPSDSDDETKDDLDVANQLIQTYISMYGMESTAIHREVQFIEEALHDIDLAEDPPFLPQDPVEDAIQVRPPCRNPMNYVGRQSYEVFEEGGHTLLHVPGKTKTCSHCRAKLTPHDYKNLSCCSKSKVKMDPYVFPDSPEMQAFKDLFKQRNFIEHIRQYNAQFNFTSIGTNEVKHNGSGPKTYCIQGQLTHNIGPLQPSLNRSRNLRQPSFAQIYMHTSEEQLQHRRNMFPAFSSRYTATIQRVMDLHNPLARTYATAKERKRTGHRGAILTPSDEPLAYQKSRADSGDSFDRTSAKLALANAASICI
ncbi:hypothetical protein DYB37_010901 [Aphanomyces astaci]|uniref:Helitron helicase-like domain-containing protein n=1 Tax=Aphanomyces astaci TaxID=112090 RepID=A0A418E7P6_APHAT|nr:hypothetical protein DYB37_010901 [Aphanomyces astaci]